MIVEGVRITGIPCGLSTVYSPRMCREVQSDLLIELLQARAPRSAVVAPIAQVGFWMIRTCLALGLSHIQALPMLSDPRANSREVIEMNIRVVLILKCKMMAGLILAVIEKVGVASVQGVTVADLWIE